MKEIPRLREMLDENDGADLHAIRAEMIVRHPIAERSARGETRKPGLDFDVEVIYLRDGDRLRYLTSGSYYGVADHVTRWLHAYNYRAGMGVTAADVALDVYTFDCGICPKMLAAAQAERAFRRESDTFQGSKAGVDVPKEPKTSEVTLYVVRGAPSPENTYACALDAFRKSHPQEVTLAVGDDAHVRAACIIWESRTEFHRDGDTEHWLVAKDVDGADLVMVETCASVNISYGGDIEPFDSEDDVATAPAWTPSDEDVEDAMALASPDQIGKIRDVTPATQAYVDASVAGACEHETDDAWRERLDVLWRSLTVDEIAVAEVMLERAGKLPRMFGTEEMSDVQ